MKVRKVPQLKNAEGINISQRAEKHAIQIQILNGTQA